MVDSILSNEINPPIRITSIMPADAKSTKSGGLPSLECVTEAMVIEKTPKVLAKYLIRVPEIGRRGDASPL